jgi:hypothetical protein
MAKRFFSRCHGLKRCKTHHDVYFSTTQGRGKMNDFDFLYDSEWRKFYDLVMWLKHGRVSREYFVDEWRKLQEGREKK